MSDQSDQRANETQDQGTGAKEAQAANLFDLRRIIGGLFVLYGVVLTIVGLGDSDAEIEKAAGVHINLWAGLGMLALGLGPSGTGMAWHGFGGEQQKTAHIQTADGRQTGRRKPCSSSLVDSGASMPRPK